MREYGSEFNKTVLNCGALKKVHYNNCVWTRCGRDSLGLIARDVLNKSCFTKKPRILVPNLHCESMILPFFENGYNCESYSINDNFEFDSNNILTNINDFDVIFIMHYFAYRDYKDFYKKLKLKNPKIIIIEDVTQIILDYDIEVINCNVDYVSGSFRKWLGVINGGIAISNSGDFGVYAKSENNEFTRLRTEAFEVKKKFNLIVDKFTELSDDSKKQLKDKYRALFLLAEKSLNYNETFTCKEEDICIIQAQDKEYLKELRKSNYQQLVYELSTIKGISLILKNEETNFMCPIIIENGNRNEVQRKLAKLGVYSQVLWPMTAIIERNIDGNDDFAKHFTSNMLALPIDQRYNKEDMKDIAGIIKTVMNKEKVLIVGASVLQLPAILKAKEMGLYVAVADYNPNAIGIKFADEYFNCSTVDHDGLFDVAKKYQPNGIMTMATDMPMRSIAYVCDQLGLPCITMETSELCTDKLRMIEKFKDYGVASPWFFSAKSQIEVAKIAKECKFPCIMKPIDSSGSRGVVLCHSESELVEEYSYAVEHSKSKVVIIEEYMVGEEVSVEVFVVGGYVHILQVTDKLTTGSPHFVEMGHSQPSVLSTEVLDDIRIVAKKAVISLGILNGPAHVEIMVTSDGAKIIEVGARMGGDCITSHLVPLSTGIDMTKETICYALGRKLDFGSSINMCSAIRFLKVQTLGFLKSVRGVDTAKGVIGIIDVVITKNIGDKISDIHSSTDRIGHVIAQSNNVDDAIRICNEAMEKISIEIGD